MNNTDFKGFLSKFKPPLSEEQVTEIAAEHERILKAEVEKAHPELQKAKLNK